MPPQQAPLPDGFTLKWANQKLAEYLKEDPNNMHYMAREGPLYHWEVGWYIYVMLNNTTYDEYVVLPNGTIYSGEAPK
jgi:hypothetical protein